MRRSIPTLVVFCVSFLALLAPGCAVNELKNTNRVLKESNDRLVAENNRLEQELAASEKEAAEKAKLLEQMQADQGTPRVASAVEETKPAKPVIDANGGFPEEPGLTAIQVPQGILLRLEDRVFFPQGRATISQKGKEILDRVGKSLNTRYRGRLIRVEGHTDDVPVKKVKNQYPSNWELSTARACTVVRYLVDSAALSPKRIYPAGFSSYKPVAASHTEAARSKNRRVEILILKETV